MNYPFWIDKFGLRLIWTVRAFFLHAYYSIVLERTLIGADVLIRTTVNGNEVHEQTYISCSEPPSIHADIKEGMDDYGMPLSVVFMYLKGLSEIVRNVWRSGREHGWHIETIQLIYLEYIDE
jgi:hypothetical protein